MVDKLTFLNQYRKNVKLIPQEELVNLEIDTIPTYWIDVLKEKDQTKKLKQVVELWKSISGDELRNTISYLSENLRDVELIIDNGNFAILYSVKVEDGIDYFEGGIPTKNINHPDLNKNWGKIPSSIRNFYENLHNGFYYFPSRAMGLVALENVTYFDNDEWGIIEDLEEPLGINLSSTFGFFNSGMGGYIAIDFNNCENDNATLWFVDDQPQYNVNFWDMVDEWIVIGFE
ncbi:SMI1/KNR4 family protein [Fictibacillus gelatini]|uniref:SMI1/KNR4 family protein n=1 Tax=Fictibacillus gelatini TaxID=225985 RepID=UPI0003FBAD5A|nr:SMI1/KNR4 family protein [Fictibacillus gelatini]